MKAKNREEYVRAWHNHIIQLAPLALAASTPENVAEMSHEYFVVKAQLLRWVEMAADQQEFNDVHNG